MLEIPEAQTLARQLDETLAGKIAVSVAAGAATHKFAFYYGDPAGYDALLAGKTFRGARALAGQVEIDFGDAAVLFADGVNARFFAAGSSMPAKHQLFIGFDDGSAIVCTVQMYGGLWAYPSGANDNPYYLAARNKPSPLGSAFDAAYFSGLLAAAKPNLSLKAFLAAEQRIPGLGNGVLQDILFNARLHPKTKLSALTGADRNRLFESIKTTLAQMAALGGRDTEKDLFGRSGGYQTRMSGNNLASGCPGCGGCVVKEAYMGGNIYYCPACQPQA